MTKSARLVLGVQGLYYAASGLWPIASMKSFEAVTGPKTEHWLVDTVGLLLVAIGASLLTAARGRGPGAAICVLAFGTAAALVAIEIVHVVGHEIGTIYLLDAAIELALAFALAWTLLRARSDD